LLTALRLVLVCFPSAES